MAPTAICGLAQEDAITYGASLRTCGLLGEPVAPVFDELANVVAEDPIGTAVVLDSDDDDEGEPSVLLHPQEFSGAAVSMLPPGEGAESVFNEPAIIGTTTSRVGNHTKEMEADPMSAKSTPEAATFPTRCPDIDVMLGGGKVNLELTWRPDLDRA